MMQALKLDHSFRKYMLSNIYNDYSASFKYIQTIPPLWLRANPNPKDCYT